jgi:hypothetical protein
MNIPMYWNLPGNKFANGCKINDIIGICPSNAAVLDTSSPYFGFSPSGY